MNSDLLTMEDLSLGPRHRFQGASPEGTFDNDGDVFMRDSEVEDVDMPQALPTPLRASPPKRRTSATLAMVTADAPVIRQEELRASPVIQHVMPQGDSLDFHAVAATHAQEFVKHSEDARKLKWHICLPQILQQWSRLLFNVCVGGALLLTLFSFCSIVKGDIDSKVAQFQKQTISEMAECARKYEDNRCQPELRVPALEKSCVDWEQCANQDLASLPYGMKFSAQTFGEAVNAFFKELDIKTLIACPSFLLVLILLVNCMGPRARPRYEEQCYVPGPMERSRIRYDDKAPSEFY